MNKKRNRKKRTKVMFPCEFCGQESLQLIGRMGCANPNCDLKKLIDKMQVFKIKD